MSKPEYTHRFAPCPVYDLEGMECWLENLAQQGLFLSASGFIGTYGTFEKREPKSVRYRLQPLQKKKYYADDGLPHRAARELAEEYGWIFVCTIEDYAIYTCDDPTVRELDTDPRIQALAIQDLCKRRRNGFLVSLAMMVFWFFRLWYRPISLLSLLPIWLFLPALLSWCLTPFTGFAELSHLRKLCKKLSQGEPLTQIAGGKHHLYRVNTLITLIAVLWVPVILVFSNFSDWREYRWEPLSEYRGNLPFSTMQELVPGEFHPEEPRELPSVGPQEATVLYEYANHVAERSTLPIPRQIALQQYGTVRLDGKLPLHGSLEVEYYELPYEWMAKQFYRELLQSHREDKYFKWMTLPELPTEQEQAYHRFEDVLILRNGCRVLSAIFDQNENGTVLELDQWAGIMAEAFMQ